MHQYHLNIQIPKSLINLKVDDGLLFIGSCFSEHISNKLKDYNFKVMEQSNGIVFNPISLAYPFKLLAQNKQYSIEDLILVNNQWKSIHHHGSIHHSNQDDLLTKINDDLISLRHSISSSKHLFITFGSAYAYTHVVKDSIVANCHKLPQQDFIKKRLTIEEISNTWLDVLNYLFQINPSLNIVLTVSPVKHLRDGVHENNLSKSTLLLSIESIIQTHQNIQYFPSYELVIDDLRDYRFFNSDLAHPNQLAIDYVFDKFTNAFLSQNAMNYLDKNKELFLLNQHIPRGIESNEYIKYMDKIKKIKLEIEVIKQSKS